MKINNKKKERHFIPMGFGVLTVSDSRTLTNDKSGDILENRILSAGHNIVARDLVKDNKVTIKKILKKWILTKNLDVIISTGGTGLTGRDVTVEAHNDLYEKKINAFEILFTKVSIETIGTSAIQSRACAGVSNATYIFCLPGSPSACKDAWSSIITFQLSSTHKPCNLVELIDRLK